MHILIGRRSIRATPKRRAWCTKRQRQGHRSRDGDSKTVCSHTPESLGYIKRLVRDAIDTPLAEGLALERNLFMRLCVSDQALARMRSYEDKKITDPSRSLEP